MSLNELPRYCLPRGDAERDGRFQRTAPVEKFIERNEVSQPLEEYTQNTQNVAALKQTRDQVVRAVESVLSPLGWDPTEIRREIAGIWVAVLSAFRERRIN